MEGKSCRLFAEFILGFFSPIGASGKLIKRFMMSLVPLRVSPKLPLSLIDIRQAAFLQDQDPYITGLLKKAPY